MTPKTLTVTALRKALRSLDLGSRTTLRDPAFPGSFEVRLSRTRVGRRTATFTVRAPGRKRKTLGVWDESDPTPTKERMSLALARQRAFEALDQAADMTIGDVMARWLDKHVDSEHKHPEITRTRALRLAPLHRLDAAAFRRRDVNAFFDGLSRGTANGLFGMLKSALNWAKERDYIDVSPLAGARLPHPTRARAEFLSLVELERLWNGVDLHCSNANAGKLIRLMILSGRRVGEIVQIRPKNVIHDQHGVWISLQGGATKNTRRDRTYLTPFAQQFLVVGGVGYDAMRYQFEKLRAAVDLDEFHQHDLRRTMITHLLERGHDKVVVQKVVNHSTGKDTLSKHYDWAEYTEQRREIAEAWSAVIEGFAGHHPESDNVLRFRR